MTEQTEPEILFEKEALAPFVLIVPVRNAAKYIEKCLTTIRNQTFSPWHAIVVDDCSDDGTADLAEKFVNENNLNTKFTLVKNTERKFALWNVCNATRTFISNPNAIIGIIDGDDWFNRKDALQVMWDAYAGPYDMVWSQHLLWPRLRPGYSGPIVQGSHRSQRRCISHFKTYRKRAFDLIPEEEFLGPDGEYMRYTYDKAITYPLSELCSDILFIDEILYVYNCENSENVHKKNLGEQSDLAKFLESKPPLG